MAIDVRTSALAAAVAIACVVVVTVRVAKAPGPVLRHAATPEQRVEIARLVAAAEPGWKLETAQNFPQDDWSQRDDFHGRELRRIVELANERGVPVEEVLRAVDDDIHRRHVTTPDARDDRNARAIPCKPRPFYD